MGCRSVCVILGFTVFLAMVAAASATGGTVNTTTALSPLQRQAWHALLNGGLNKSDVEIVVAHYKESVEWLRPYVNFTTLYTKGVSEPSHGFSVVHLGRNVGKESHAYLSHIVQRYDNLSTWTVFTQDQLPTVGYDRGVGGHLMSGAIFDDYVLAYAAYKQFYFVASSAVEPVTLNHRIRTAYHEFAPFATRGDWGVEECPSKANETAWGPWFSMRRDNFEPWVAQYRDCGGKLCASLSDFAYAYGIQGNFDEGIPILFSQGARFAVSKKRLLQHPKSYYERLLQMVTSGQDPWQSYYYEYLWFNMLAASDGEVSFCGNPSFDPASLLGQVVPNRALSGVSGFLDNATNTSVVLSGSTKLDSVVGVMVSGVMLLFSVLVAAHRDP